jgi:RHS repeat-associated protein
MLGIDLKILNSLIPCSDWLELTSALWKPKLKGYKTALLRGRRIGVYPGQYYDSETGLHYNYFRYYNPQTGRYLTPDPIGLEGGTNLFAYVEGNPANRIDPLGLWFDDMYQTYQGTIPVSVWALLPNVPQPVSDFVAGFGDTLTSGFGLTYLFGLPSGTQAIRGLWEEAFDLPNVVDPCSKSFKAGKYSAYAWGVAFSYAAATGGGPWLGKIAPHGPHASGPHQYPHLQIMIRVGKYTTKHIRIPWLFVSYHREAIMLCDYCKKTELIEGTLEGVSFEPGSEHKKVLSSGVYGIKAMACPSCGRLSDFALNVEALKKMLKK